MKTKHLTYLLGISLFLYNCSSSSPNDLIDQEPDPDPSTEITYDDDIKSILNNRCTGCHGNPTQNGAPFSLTTFNSAKNRIDDIISRINNASNPMPPSGLMSQEVRDEIQQWKDDGLLEN